MSFNREVNATETKANGATLLIVDDEAVVRLGHRVALQGFEFSAPLQILEASSLAEAYDLLARHEINVVLMDKHLGPNRNDPGQDGVEGIPEVRRIRPWAQVYLVTTSEDGDDIAQAYKLGAHGYVSKRKASENANDIFFAMVNKAINDSFNLRRLSLAAKGIQEGKNTVSYSEPVSIVMREAENKAFVYARPDFPILLEGPSGAGKTELARRIHQHLKDNYPGVRNFVNVSTPAISRELIEGEFFGYEKGSFTGASKDHAGYFELADKGTIFLDEIGDISPELQVKLLKVIAEKQFYRVGDSETPIYTDCKIITATNRNLKKLVEQGEFREDLYLRLKVLTIDVPGLSERREDIPGIVRALMPKIAKKAKFEKEQYSDLPSSFIEYLTSDAPIQGNIRDLEEQMALLIIKAPLDRNGRKIFTHWRRILKVDPETSSGSAQPFYPSWEDLMNAPLDTSAPGFPGIRSFFKTIERKLYEDANTKHGGNCYAIGKALGVSKSTAHRVLQEIELSEPSPPSSTPAQTQSKSQKGAKRAYR